MGPETGDAFINLCTPIIISRFSRFFTEATLHCGSPTFSQTLHVCNVLYEPRVPNGKGSKGHSTNLGDTTKLRQGFRASCSSSCAREGGGGSESEKYL